MDDRRPQMDDHGRPSFPCYNLSENNPAFSHAPDQVESHDLKVSTQEEVETHGQGLRLLKSGG